MRDHSVKIWLVLTLLASGTLVHAGEYDAAKPEPSKPAMTPEPAAPKASPEASDFGDAVFGGKFTFDLRIRYENVDQDGLMDANAGTARARVGYGTKPLEGFSAFFEGEFTVPFDGNSYNAGGLNGQPGKAVVADPENYELNQAYGKYERNGVTFIGGRQRIILDDARFVGNVGWRQNEQTFDAATIKYTGFKDWTLFYGYAWDVHRIFGYDGRDNFMTDFDNSDVHMFNVAYDGLILGDWKVGKITGFAYLLNFDGSPARDALSSNTFGVRLAGAKPLVDDMKLGYTLSYAHQSDASGNPVNYDANYYLAELALVFPQIKGGVGYEVLGSDDGVAAFQTPLATLHAFNGWADVFLTTPAAGLQDLYVFANATLPWEIKAGAYYHWFYSENTSADLGQEFDAVASKAINKNVTVLFKYADFVSDAAPADRSKIWIEIDVKF